MSLSNLLTPAPPLPTLVDLRRVLKLRHFRLVETLVGTRNMRLAGERLGLSAAAVSKSCIEIESLIGMRLFDRTKDGLMPSAVCIRLLESGRRIEAELRVLNEELPALDGSVHGTVRIGLQAPALQAAVARTICDIKTRHPYLMVQFDYGMRERLLGDLQMNRLDLVVFDLFEIENHPWVASLPLARDRCVVVAPRDRRLPRDDAMDWDRLSQRCWIIPSAGLAMRPLFERMLATAGLRMPPNRIEINSQIESAALLEMPGSVAWAPLSILDTDRLVAEETLLPEPQTVLGLVWQRNAGLTSGARAFGNALAARFAAEPPFPA